jgi:hypothetical protein
MVRALLDGRKTQTRRIMTRRNVEVLGQSWAGKNNPWEGLRFDEAVVRDRSAISGRVDSNLAVPFCHPADEPTPSDECGIYRITPVVQPGDLLWVRENWARVSEFEPIADIGALYRADPMYDGCAPGDFGWKWTPSIHMPRWASRLTLAVTSVKIERLNDISENDAAAEGWPALQDRPKTGVAEIRDAYPIGWYAALWDSINGKGSWDANPFVVAITFTVHRGNIDAIPLPNKDTQG